MPKDRLDALRARRRFSEDEDPRTPAGAESGGALAFGYQLLVECEQLEDFLCQVNEVRNLIDVIRADVKRVKVNHSALLASPIMDEKIRQELETLTDRIKVTSNKVRVKLKSFEAEIETGGFNKTSAELRIRRTQHATLARTFVDVMTTYNQAQVEHRERCKSRFQRQLELTGRKTTNDELEDMLEQGTPVILFTQDIVFQETEMARKTLADIEARHQDILKLERSICELHTMFLDMAFLVDRQGEMIDRIEHNVTAAVDFVESAKKKTKKALVYQGKARRKLIVILAISAVVLIIIVGSIAGRFGGRRR